MYIVNSNLLQCPLNNTCWTVFRAEALFIPSHITVPSHFPGGKTDNPDPVTKWPIEDETENCRLDAHSLELELYRIFINSLAPRMEK
jgi:hypothetical protein